MQGASDDGGDPCLASRCGPGSSLWCTPRGWPSTDAVAPRLVSRASGCPPVVRHAEVRASTARPPFTRQLVVFLLSAYGLRLARQRYHQSVCDALQASAFSARALLKCCWTGPWEMLYTGRLLTGLHRRLLRSFWSGVTWPRITGSLRGPPSLRLFVLASSGLGGGSWGHWSWDISSSRWSGAPSRAWCDCLQCKLCRLCPLCSLCVLKGPRSRPSPARPWI